MRCQWDFKNEGISLIPKTQGELWEHRHSGPHKRPEISLTLWGGSGFSLLTPHSFPWNEEEAMQCSGRQPLQHQGFALLILPEALGVEPKASCKPDKYYTPVLLSVSILRQPSCHINLPIIWDYSPEPPGPENDHHLQKDRGPMPQSQGHSFYSILHENLFSVCCRPHPCISVVSLVRWDLQVQSPIQRDLGNDHLLLFVPLWVSV